MALYRSNGRIVREGDELFAEASWLQVMHGQRVRPTGYHPFADLRSKETVSAFLGDIKSVIGKCVGAMPTHAEFIAANCAVGAGKA
jgi:tryptophan halogenase